MKLELELHEINLIMEALGNMPFIRVYLLIGKIRDQASKEQKEEQTDQAVKDNGQG